MTVMTTRSRMVRMVYAFVAWLVGLAFRRIESRGQEQVPTTGGVVFVANHPNGLLDGALLATRAPRPVSMLAKKPLFSMPIVGPLLRAVGALPVVRRQDSEGGCNEAMFDAVHGHLKTGGAIALFPEGISHDETRVMPLKTGAARMALGGDARWIVPVGLHYEDKVVFRRDAVMQFGAPIEVDPAESAVELTERIRVALEGVVVTSEDPDAYGVVDTAVRTTVTASLFERTEVMKRALTRLASMAPGERNAVVGRLRAAAQLGWSANSRFSWGNVVMSILLAPLALLGWLTAIPLEGLIEVLARRHSTDRDILPSARLVGGLLFFPVAWVAGAIAAGWWGGALGLLLFGVGWPLSLTARIAARDRLRCLRDAVRRGICVMRNPGSLATVGSVRSELTRLTA